MGLSGIIRNKALKSQFLGIIKESDIDLIEKDIIKQQKNPIKESNVNLLDLIKSFYIQKNIFSYLEKKRILQLFMYNKKYQNIFKYNLDYYKKYAGKETIMERGDIVKCYCIHSRRLLFEGMYLRGKRIKYGREYYYDGELKYEGYYLDGEKSGKGKEYICNHLIYSGEYKNDKKNGKGQEYNNKGAIIFQGVFFNGKKWNGFGYNVKGIKVYDLKGGQGIVREYFDNGLLLYEGEYSNGERNGIGKEYNSKEKLVFEGQYLNGKRWNGIKYLYEYYNDENSSGKVEYMDGKKIKSNDN